MYYDPSQYIDYITLNIVLVWNHIFGRNNNFQTTLIWFKKYYTFLSVLINYDNVKGGRKTNVYKVICF